MITGSKTRLCRKRLSDAANDYAWKTDPELAKLTAAPPLKTSFTDYLLKYAGQLRRSTKHEFGIETLDSRHIGNCACYGINQARSEAEVGIIIGDRNYWDKGYGQDALNTMVSYILGQMKLKRIHLKTLISNKRAQKCFAKCGFTTYGQIVKNGHSFVLMELLLKTPRTIGSRPEQEKNARIIRPVR